MAVLVIAIHVLVCIVLTIVVLLQQGKGAGVGAVFGGSSQTVFGSSGAGNFLTKLTGALAVVFFVTSMFLAYASTKHVTSSIFDRPARNRAVPAKPAPIEKPVAPAVPAPAAPAQK